MTTPAETKDAELPEEDEPRRDTPRTYQRALIATIAVLLVTWVLVVATQGATFFGVAIAVLIGLVFLVAFYVFPDRSEDGRKVKERLFGAALGVPGLLLTLMQFVPDGAIEPPIPEQVLRAALLRPEDLPDGWEYIPETEITGPRGIAAENYCGEPVEVAPDVEVYTAFAEPPGLFSLRESVFSTVAAFPEGSADDFMREIAGAARCGEWQPGNEGLVYEVEPDPEMASEVGGDALWLDLSNSGGGPQTAIHVYVRVENVVGHVAYNVPESGGPSVDPLSVARSQLERIEGLLDSL